MQILNPALEQLFLENNLGKIIETPKQIPGGQLHTVFYIKSETGEYAVKKLNHNAITNIDYYNSYEKSETIANYFLLNNIPAVTALKINNHFVIKNNNNAYLIYPFIAGKAIPGDKINIIHATQIGKIFANIHNINLKLEVASNHKYDHYFFDNNTWLELIKRSKNPGLEKLLPTILKWNTEYKDLLPTLKQQSVLTHRDLHCNNVLWDKNNLPCIIDWETAGYMHPDAEIIGFALEWAGLINNQTINNIDFLTTLLQSYISTHHDFNLSLSVQHALYGWLGDSVLGWVEYNTKRMLGEISNNPKEILLGKEIINKYMVPVLLFLANNEQALLQKLNKILNL